MPDPEGSALPDPVPGLSGEGEGIALPITTSTYTHYEHDWTDDETFNPHYVVDTGYSDDDTVSMSLDS